MCVVAVSWPPPPIQANLPCCVIWMICGSSVVSPRPHTKRGRTTTVSRPLPLASRTACSALAFDQGYGAGESGRSGAVSSTFTSGWPAISAASVPTCTKRGTFASRAASSAFLVPWTVTRWKSAGSPKSSTFAAAWWNTSAPSAPARIAFTSSRSPRTASAPARSTDSTERSERASARTVQPWETSLRMSAPPTKPEPPVTNAVGTTAEATASPWSQPCGAAGALVGCLLERVVGQWLELGVQGQLDQPVGEPRVLRQQRTVQIGADHVAAAHALVAVAVVVAVA